MCGTHFAELARIDDQIRSHRAGDRRLLHRHLVEMRAGDAARLVHAASRDEGLVDADALQLLQRGLAGKGRRRRMEKPAKQDQPRVLAAAEDFGRR